LSYLFQYLPPFAADYSGVASALHDLGGLVVIHDASGCTGSFTGYDEPRWFSGKSSVYCSGLREIDAIMGNDSRLLDNIRSIIEKKQFNFVAVVGSPVPMLVGFDFDGFARISEEEFGIPVFGFPTTGLARYEQGMSAAFLALARRFVGEPEEKRKGANILGASPLDNFDGDTLMRLREFLAENGLPVVSVWGQGDEWESMPKASSASINLVVSAAALPLAEYMKNRWAIPYVAGLPLGEETARELKSQIKQGGGGAVARSGAISETDKSARVFLIGEQLRMNAFRSELLFRYPSLDAVAGSFFAWNASLSSDGDCFIENESALIRCLEEGNFDVVVGDPLLRELMPGGLAGRFVEEPHYGLSARLYREHSLSRRFCSASFMDGIAALALGAPAPGGERAAA
jgi:hypothetical protein